MEVLDKASYAGFLCHRCDFLLVQMTDENRGGHEQSTKLNSQFKFITDKLPKLDSVPIPENTFEQALASARKVNRDATNPASETAPLDAAVERPTAVKGLTNIAPTTIAVTLTKSEGPTDADIAAEKDRKLKNAAQNALPQHFTHSTITGEQVKFDPNSGPSTLLSVDDKKDVIIDDAAANGQSDEIDSYFAQLKADQAKEAALERDEEYETDDEEEEDEFEDVVPTASGAGTPASSFNEGRIGLASSLPSALKKGGSASGSGTSTGVTSPVTGPNTPSNEDGRLAKRVRIEEPAPKDEEESEEDVEFEDV